MAVALLPIGCACLVVRSLARRRRKSRKVDIPGDAEGVAQGTLECVRNPRTGRRRDHHFEVVFETN